VAGGEILTAIAAGADPATLVLHGNAKTTEEIELAVRYGVGTVVVDNLDDIDRLESIIPAGRRQACLVRVFPAVHADTHHAVATGHEGSKFGLAPAPPSRPAWLPMKQRLTRNSSRALICDIWSRRKGGTMPKDLMFILPYQAGMLAKLTGVLGSAGVNLEGCCMQEFGPEEIVHFFVEDATAARRAAEQAGFVVRGEREVLVTPVEDRPGGLERLLAPIANAGVSADLVYQATSSRVVIGVVEDLDRAKAALRPTGP
jgi:hypothetical protein